VPKRISPRDFTPALAAACFLLVTGLAAAGELPGPAPSRLPAPKVHFVRPNTGPLAGQIEVTIEGANFDDVHEGLAVRFGGVDALYVGVGSPQRLHATLPPRAKSGVVDVEVVNPDGGRGVAQGAFCYVNGNQLTAFWFRVRQNLRLAWRFARLGGWIIAVLVAISIGTVAWCIHLVLSLRASQIMPDTFVNEVASRIQRGELESAARLCEREDYVFARVVGAGLAKAKEFPAQVRDAIAAAGSREASHLHQKISYLSNVGVISPMLGLLGTIIGMIRLFEAIAEQGSRYVYMAGALYQAMITTCAGLMIGIPAMILYFYFRGRVLRLVMSMEESAERVAEGIDTAATPGAPQ